MAGRRPQPAVHRRRPALVDATLTGHNLDRSPKGLCIRRHGWLALFLAFLLTGCLPGSSNRAEPAASDARPTPANTATPAPPSERPVALVPATPLAPNPPPSSQVPTSPAPSQASASSQAPSAP